MHVAASLVTETHGHKKRSTTVTLAQAPRVDDYHHNGYICAGRTTLIGLNLPLCLCGVMHRNNVSNKHEYFILPE